VFVGHYGVSLAAKRWAPRLSLGWLFLAVQALDLLFATFVLAGVEKMAIVPGFTAYNPYDLFFMPYSHSLLGAFGWVRRHQVWVMRAGGLMLVAVGVLLVTGWWAEAVTWLQINLVSSTETVV